MEPFVLRNLATKSNYVPMQWTLDMFPKMLKNSKIEVRLASKVHLNGHIEYEPQCTKLEIESDDFIKWIKGEVSVNDSDNEILADSHNYWAYFDYNNAEHYLKEEFFAEVGYAEKLGLPSTPRDEAFWFGTPGAHTPCHYDTYGFNVHLQIAGRKRWIVFPPNDPMRPSRFPYEESTVYSRYDIAGGVIPANSHPLLVDLNPGDLLFLPPKWWHCVISLGENAATDYTFSMTKWIPLEDDTANRGKEALVSVIMELVQEMTTLNPQGTMFDAVSEFAEKIPALLSPSTSFTSSSSETDGPSPKQPRLSDPPKTVLDSFYETYSSHGERLRQFIPLELSRFLRRNTPFRNELVNVTAPGLNCDNYTWNVRSMIVPWSTEFHDIIDAFCDESTMEHVSMLLSRVNT